MKIVFFLLYNNYFCISYVESEAEDGDPSSNGTIRICFGYGSAVYWKIIQLVVYYMINGRAEEVIK